MIFLVVKIAPVIILLTYLLLRKSEYYNKKLASKIKKMSSYSPKFDVNLKWQEVYCEDQIKFVFYQLITCEIKNTCKYPLSNILFKLEVITENGEIWKEIKKVELFLPREEILIKESFEIPIYPGKSLILSVIDIDLDKEVYQLKLEEAEKENIQVKTYSEALDFVGIKDEYTKVKKFKEVASKIKKMSFYLPKIEVISIKWEEIKCFPIIQYEYVICHDVIRILCKNNFFLPLVNVSYILEARCKNGDKYIKEKKVTTIFEGKTFYIKEILADLISEVIELDLKIKDPDIDLEIGRYKWSVEKKQLIFAKSYFESFRYLGITSQNEIEENAIRLYYVLRVRYRYSSKNIEIREPIYNEVLKFQYDPIGDCTKLVKSEVLISCKIYNGDVIPVTHLTLIIKFSGGKVLDSKEYKIIFPNQTEVYEKRFNFTFIPTEFIEFKLFDNLLGEDIIQKCIRKNSVSFF